MLTLTRQPRYPVPREAARPLAHRHPGGLRLQPAGVPAYHRDVLSAFCPACGAPVPVVSAWGRRRLYCDGACRIAAHRDRQAGRTGTDLTALQVQRRAARRARGAAVPTTW